MDHVCTTDCDSVLIGSSSPGESPTESLTSSPLLGDNPGKDSNMTTFFVPYSLSLFGLQTLVLLGSPLENHLPLPLPYSAFQEA